MKSSFFLQKNTFFRQKPAFYGDPPKIDIFPRKMSKPIQCVGFNIFSIFARLKRRGFFAPFSDPPKKSGFFRFWGQKGKFRTFLKIFNLQPVGMKMTFFYPFFWGVHPYVPQKKLEKGVLRLWPFKSVHFGPFLAFFDPKTVQKGGKRGQKGQN
jgi:hypothetical protein